jgi:hypothetical protein
MIDEKSTRINSVSSCFCLAKWLQVTVDLVNGTTQSCHHPRRHPIPPEELSKSPSALHNTRQKMSERRMMLEGRRPADCGYCWRIEDLGKGLKSDRIIKSSDPWAYPHLDRVRATPWDVPVDPTYLEVMLDDLCNFSCAYCSAAVSSSIGLEMAKWGPYRVLDAEQRMPPPPPRVDPAPFYKAFWQWLPDIIGGLHTLRVTGGEPLLSPHYSRLIQLLEARPCPDLHFVVNSHLGHPDRRIDSFIAQLGRLMEKKQVGSIEVYTSVDAAGSRAEYLRHGLDYAQFMKNLAKVSTLLPSFSAAGQVVLMSTFNILSISSFDQLLSDVHALKGAPGARIAIDLSYLANPRYLRATLADPPLRESLVSLEGAMDGPRSSRFTEHERTKLHNVLTWSLNHAESGDLDQGRRDFFSFIKEYDRRKNRNFISIYPEYREFLIECKKAYFGRLGSQT